MNQSPHRGLHRFTCLLALATFLLLVAGANVTSHRAGLSVPDWPTTYGQSMFTFPVSKWVGNIFYEHGHRLIASGVGMLTIVLTFWLVLKEPRRWVRRLGILALAAVIAQGILGGLTVKLMLPPPISIAHASLAEAYFCLTVTLAFVTSASWITGPVAVELSGSKFLQHATLATTIAIYLQIVLGATIRHAEHAVIAHILGAAVVLVAAATVIAALRSPVKQPQVRQSAILLLGLIVIQSVLGLLTWWVRAPKNADTQLSAMQIVLPTVHLALGALILAVSLGLTLKSYRFFYAPKADPSVPFAAGALS